MIKLSLYPRIVSLRDGTEVTLRPMQADDSNAVLAFFNTIPENQRFFLKDDVTDPSTIGAWASLLDYRRALPLLAFANDTRVVADATLIRRRGGFRTHIAELRIVVAPEFRNRGLSVTLLRDLCDIANDAELEKAVIEVVSPQEDIIRAAEWMGFYRAATLEGLAKNQDGQDCDVVIMVMPLGRYYEWSKF